MRASRVSPLVPNDSFGSSRGLHDQGSQCPQWSDGGRGRQVPQFPLPGMSGPSSNRPTTVSREGVMHKLD